MRNEYKTLVMAGGRPSARATLKVLAILLCLFFVKAQSSSSEGNSTSLLEDVTSLLRSHHISGGIVEYSACIANDVHFDMQGDTVQSQLNSLPVSAQVHWQLFSASDTYFVEIGKPPLDTLLATPLPALIVKGDTLSQESGYLFDSPPVASKAGQLGIKIYFSFGFSSVGSRPKLPELKMPAGTLAEDLNRLAAQQPGAVWYLSQRSCENRVVDSFSWASL